jgi:hypothetical protein
MFEEWSRDFEKLKRAIERHVSCGLSWDLVPKAGVIEAPVLEGMRALAQLLRTGETLWVSFRDS